MQTLHTILGRRPGAAAGPGPTPRPARSLARPVLVVLAAALLAGCGQRGPLILPPAEAGASAPGPAR